MVRAGVGAGIFDKLEPELEPEKNGPAPQHCFRHHPKFKSYEFKITGDAAVDT
jgi:hypothetical protein